MINNWLELPLRLPYNFPRAKPIICADFFYNQIHSKNFVLTCLRLHECQHLIHQLLVDIGVWNADGISKPRQWVTIEPGVDDVVLASTKPTEVRFLKKNDENWWRYGWTYFIWHFQFPPTDCRRHNLSLYNHMSLISFVRDSWQ